MKIVNIVTVSINSKYSFHIAINDPEAAAAFAANLNLSGKALPRRSRDAIAITSTRNSGTTMSKNPLEKITEEECARIEAKRERNRRRRRAQKEKKKKARAEQAQRASGPQAGPKAATTTEPAEALAGEEPRADQVTTTLPMHTHHFSNPN
ncbi:hypothetical protein VTH82DRAFT_1707 [Thermothelomyces myriococcoides]